MIRRQVLAVAVVLTFWPLAPLAQDAGFVAFPSEYREWYQHHTTVNLKGHTPEGEVGIQNVYVNAKARAGLHTGIFDDGAIFVVDRFSYEDEGNSTLKQDTRKVIAVMLRGADRYRATGGWGFQAFKGGDPDTPVVKDAGVACFACHAPLVDNNFLFTPAR